MCERSKQTKLKCNNENWKVKLIRVRRETSFSDLSRFWLSCLDPYIAIAVVSFFQNISNCQLLKKKVDI
jgi:hypothetical protein